MADDFTFGIEEEYFLVDARDQARRPRRAAGVLRRRQGGDRRPHLDRIPAAADRGDHLAALQHGGRARGAAPSAPDRRRGRGRARPRHPRRRHASDRALAQGAADRQGALRQRDARPADDRPARPAVRHARACRAARSRRARRRDVPDAALSAAVPRAVDLLAVLAVAARPGSRATGSPPTTSCRAPACPSCSAPARSSTPMWRRWCAPA